MRLAMMKALVPVLLGASLAAGAFASPEDGAVPVEKKIPLEDADAFAFDIVDEDAIVVHPLSGLVCPFAIEDHQLTRLAQFSLSGHDVSCGYNMPDGHSTLTFYFSRYGETATAEQTVEGALAAMRQNGNFADEIRNGPVTMNFGGTESPDCRSIVLESDPATGVKKTGVWGCNFGGWVYKVRATWAVPDAVMQAGVEAFGKAQAKARSRLDMCKAWETGEDSVADTIQDTTTTMLLMATLGVDDALRPPVPSEGCFVGGWNDDKSAISVIAYPGSETMAWQVNSADVNGYVSQRVATITNASGLLNLLADDDGPAPAATGAWLLLGEVSETKTGLFRVYASRPGTSQATSDIVDLLDGNLPALASRETGEDGNTALSLSLPD